MYEAHIGTAGNATKPTSPGIFLPCTEIEVKKKEKKKKSRDNGDSSYSQEATSGKINIPRVSVEMKKKRLIQQQSTQRLCTEKERSCTCGFYPEVKVK